VKGLRGQAYETQAENTAPPVETRGANEGSAERSVLCFKEIQAAVFSIVA
jgi:hypothetical protein